MRERYLVTGANGDIGEAIGRILRETYPDARIEGADAAGVWPGASVFDVVHQLPRADQSNYVEELVRLGKAGFDAIFPTSEPEISRLVRDIGEIGDLPVILSRSEIVATFLDKLETANWLRSHNFNPPVTKRLADADGSDLPLILKPRRGAGGRGQEIVRSLARLDVARMERPADTVAQQLLDVEDREYTCALLSYGRDTRFIMMRRTLAGDRTSKATVENLPEVCKLLDNLAAAARPEGPLNVQLRLMPEGPKIFEINPRFSSTVMMRHRLGFCDVVWSLERRKGKALPDFVPPVNAIAYRLAREVVVFAEPGGNTFDRKR
jgi:carbamoyl-phosphate synthase large subunit